MSELDLNNMDLAELKRLQKDIAKAITNFADRKKIDALAALEAHAKELGFSLSELMGAPAKKTPRTGAAAKYMHPENPSITWSGRGRKPHWFRDALAAGKSAESLEI